MAYSDEVLADSPLLYLKMDETSGATAADSSGNGRNGTHSAGVAVNQASLLGDESGASAGYAEANLAMTTVPFGSWMNASTITVEARVRPDAAGLVGTSCVASRYPTSGLERVWRLDILDGKVRGIVRQASTGTDKIVTGATSLVAGTSHTVAMTYDGSTLRIYLDGALEGSLSVGSAISTTTGSDIVVGSTVSGSTSHADALIDEVSVTSAALPGVRMGERHAAAAATTTSTDVSLAGTLPTVTGAFTLDATAPAVAVSLAGSLPAVAASFALDVPGAAPSIVDLSFAGSLPSIQGAFALDVTATRVATTDTFNRTNGRTRSGTGWANLDEPVAAVPATVTREPIRVMAQTLPAPTLEKGRPV